MHCIPPAGCCVDACLRGTIARLQRAEASKGVLRVGASCTRQTQHNLTLTSGSLAVTTAQTRQDEWYQTCTLRTPDMA